MLTDLQRYNGTVIGGSSRVIAISVRKLRHYDAIHAQIEAETVRPAVARWIDASGYRYGGYAREATLEHNERPLSVGHRTAAAHRM